MPAEAQKNPLEMSDEELLNTPAPEPVVQEVVNEPEGKQGTEEEDSTEAGGSSDREQPEGKHEAQGTVSEEDAKPTSKEPFRDGDTGEAESDTDVSEKERKDTQGDGSDAEGVGETTEEVRPSAEDFMKQVTAPFKANGKQMQIESAEDVIALMKMGANYNKKMAGLKPNLKLMKMLQNNDLLDEGKLSFLIDLNKRNPEAIAKLIKESGIDPLDVDVEKGEEYRPNTYTVNDKEVELDQVLADIRGSEAYETTIDVISNKWDAKSKQVLFEHPGVIRLINDHIETGIYQQITDIIERERTLGRMTDLTDIEAYKAVGDALQAKGAFVNQQRPPANEEQTENKPKPDPKLKNRKKAASPTGGGPAGNTKKQFDPLAMSDEEFMKIADSQFI